MKKSAHDLPDRLPIKLDNATNGEFAPLAPDPLLPHIERLALARAGEHARRLGVSRRDFLIGACGAATTLLAMNEGFAWAGRTVGGRYDLPSAAALDLELARQRLEGDEFILDDQTHHVNPDGPWRDRDRRWNAILPVFPQGSCGLEDPVDCFSARHYIEEIFLSSDTQMAVLSHPPAPADANPLTMEEAAATRALVDAMDGSRRLVLQGLVIPSLPPHQSQLDRMDEMAETGIGAWKTYTNWGPDGGGWWLDDPHVGIPYIERARELGVKTIAIHKGLPFSEFDQTYSSCRDIGVVARRYPDVNFVVYHSGYDPRVPETAYDPTRTRFGLNTLVKSLEDNGVGPNENVYTELGATWRIVMRNPTLAAHVLGKLLRYVGESNVMWGTDCIWWGSPQDQIQAFRAFQIEESYQERFGYPALTPTLKRKVFGLNALAAYRIADEDVVHCRTADRIARIKTAYREARQPGFTTLGPRTRREFLALRRQAGDLPG